MGLYVTISKSGIKQRSSRTTGRLRTGTQEEVSKKEKVFLLTPRPYDPLNFIDKVEFGLK